MSIFKDDKERKEFYTTRDKKEDKGISKIATPKAERVEAELTKAPEPKAKSIYNLKTFDELLEYYYVIPKCVIFDEDVQKAIKIACIKSREKTNINLVRRGKKHKKLTKEQEKEIRQSNLSNAKLSKIYDVSTTTIFRVKHSQE